MTLTACTPRVAERSPSVAPVRKLAPRPYARVLLAPWGDADQAALDTAARSGLVVFGVVNGRITLLPECRMTGQYLYIGTNPTLQAVSLDDDGEIAMNLASTPRGPAKAAPIKMEMCRIGRFATTRRRADKNALLGSCAGATHFARTLTVGALASLGGVATSACSTAGERDSGPPAGCRRFLRADLVAFDGPDVDPADVERCPPGWALAAGVCVERTSSRPHECADDPRECRAQCDLGSRASCTRLGHMLAHGERGFIPDEANAMAFYGRACDAGYAAACFEMGELYARDAQSSDDATKASSLWNRACTEGYTAACVRLGQSLPRDASGSHDRALSLFRRACSGGDPVGCLRAAEVQRGAPAADADQEIATLLDLACDGDLAAGCSRLADWLKSHGAPSELYRGPEQKACRLGAPDACESGAESVTR